MTTAQPRAASIGARDVIRADWMTSHIPWLVPTAKSGQGKPLTTVNAIGGAIRGAHMGEPYGVKWYLECAEIPRFKHCVK